MSDDAQVENLEVVATDASEEEAGFNSVEGTPADNAEVITQEVQTETTRETSEQQETQQEATQEATAENQEQSIDEARAQLQAMLDALPKDKEATEQQIRKIHGKLGEMNQRLQQIGSPTKLKINPEKLTRISSDFDPEFAKSIAEDLSEALEFAQGGDTTQLVAEVEARLTNQFEQKMQVNLLTVMHKDWRSIQASPEFAEFVSKLPEEEQQEINSTWDAVYLGDVFTKFKETQATKVQTQQKSTQRLANAIIPKGQGGTVKVAAMTEEDGFNSVANAKR